MHDDTTGGDDQAQDAAPAHVDGRTIGRSSSTKTSLTGI